MASNFLNTIFWPDTLKSDLVFLLLNVRDNLKLKFLALLFLRSKESSCSLNQMANSVAALLRSTTPCWKILFHLTIIWWCLHYILNGLNWHYRPLSYGQKRIWINKTSDSHLRQKQKYWFWADISCVLTYSASWNTASTLFEPHS